MNCNSCGKVISPDEEYLVNQDPWSANIAPAYCVKCGLPEKDKQEIARRERELAAVNRSWPCSMCRRVLDIWEESTEQILYAGRLCHPCRRIMCYKCLPLVSGSKCPKCNSTLYHAIQTDLEDTLGNTRLSDDDALKKSKGYVESLPVDKNIPDAPQIRCPDCQTSMPYTKGKCPNCGRSMVFGITTSVEEKRRVIEQKKDKEFSSLTRYSTGRTPGLYLQVLFPKDSPHWYRWGNALEDILDHYHRTRGGHIVMLGAQQVSGQLPTDADMYVVTTSMEACRKRGITVGDTDNIVYRTLTKGDLHVGVCEVHINVLRNPGLSKPVRLEKKPNITAHARDKAKTSGHELNENGICTKCGSSSTAIEASSFLCKAAPARQLSKDIEQAARELLLKGQKMSAINLVRKRTGLDFKEAKHYVESLQVVKPVKSELSAQEVTGLNKKISNPIIKELKIIMAWAVVVILLLWLLSYSTK